ncbi:SPFH domain-containing protein [Niabella beijingensis]|uniref:SPFH domain-containing protein n=1 Tax=Niabella beijingensis TaxID=2872700 RepID=UPI001CBD0B90|nr:SPFH domain-containing protein [Niabella beijingensis]MBZ4192638.1 SPFH domain-containing protein [Niabella beijingensis]
MNLPFIEIIESPTPDPNLLMWKFADKDREIKNGAQLTVRESQQAMLLNQGQLADVFQPGLHRLATENVPILSRLKGWKYGFESPFKADVYFFNTYHFINNKWGTPAPILMQDSQFGQVRVRAFGSFDIKIADAGKFFRTYAGTFPRLTIFELQGQLRDFVAPKFGEVLAQEQIPLTSAAGNITDLSRKIEPHLKPYFETLGLELTQFIITSVTLPEEVTAFYDKVTNMNMVADMDKFTRFNTANAIGEKGTALNDATQTALAMGVLLNQVQQNNTNATPQQAPAATPPPNDITAKLQQLKILFENGLIDEDEYKAKKADLLTQL